MQNQFPGRVSDEKMMSGINPEMLFRLTSLAGFLADQAPIPASRLSCTFPVASESVLVQNPVGWMSG